MAAPSFSTRSAIFTKHRRPSCCACCRTARCSGRGRAVDPCGGSGHLGDEPPSRRVDRGREVPLRISSIVSASSRSGCPLLASGREDIRDLAEYFLEEFCARNNFRRKTLDDGVVPILERYDWPGNVRELRNTVERMAILTPGHQHHGGFDSHRDPASALRLRRRSSRRPRRGRTRSHPPGARRRRTGTSRAQRACWALSGRTCTSAFARSASAGSSCPVVSARCPWRGRQGRRPHLARGAPPRRHGAAVSHTLFHDCAEAGLQTRLD